MIVTLVITMVIAGHDVERHEKIASLPECWDRARAVMEHIREHVDVTQVGVGCVVDAGQNL
jgi:hypothetical protein